MKKHMGNVRRERNSKGRNCSTSKTLIKVNIAFDGLISRFNMAEESKLINRLIGTSKLGKQIEKIQKRVVQF